MTTAPAPVDLAAAYERCEEITRAEARNFSYGIRLLPRPKRQALSAVYAIARRIDDIGDGDLPDPEKRRRLDEVDESLRRLPDPGPDHDPVLVAVGDTVERFDVPVGALREIVTGCRADVDGTSYRTIDDLVGYCRYVAGSVGRLSVAIYSPARIAEARPLADSLGVALQLTNILRDLCEDRQEGRIYLPQEDLDRFGCTLDLDDTGVLADPPDRFADLVRFQAGRARTWYADGLRLLPLLDRRSAACTAAMAGIYHRLLDRIEADPEQVRGQRLSLSGRAKLGVAVQALVRGSA